MICPNCGTQLNDSVAFCPNCGTPKPASTTPAAPAAAAAAGKPPKVPLGGPIFVALISPLLGIPAVICSVIARDGVKKGNYAKAKTLATVANVLMILAVVFLLLGFLILKNL